MTALRYKNYVWKSNPDTIKVEQARNVKRLKLPFSGELLQDYGSEKRAVTGTGKFFGKEALLEFNRLAAVFLTKGSGLLCIPGVAPFLAIPLSLELTGEARPNYVAYSFALLEDEQRVPDDGVLFPRKYICRGGENLWELAERFGSTADAILAKNPWIKWPNDLEAGGKVVLVEICSKNCRRRKTPFAAAPYCAAEL